jgi:two-component system CheB/CheR fusion protein
MRILIADDDVDTVATLMLLLGDAGYEVRGVSCGPDVLQAVFSFAPDVVLMDIAMPQMSGYEVARRLRERYGSARPALVAVTALTRTLDRAAAQAAGFEHHIAKPPEPKLLLALIAGLAAGVPGRAAR